MLDDPSKILAAVQQGGVVALLVLVLVGGATKRWVFWWQFDDVKAQRDQQQKRGEDLQRRLEDMTTQRDEWRSVAWQALGTADRGRGIAKRAMALAEQHEQEHTSGTAQ
jgi:hypothetical protein